jgi:hypothetical protein
MSGLSLSAHRTRARGRAGKRSDGDEQGESAISGNLHASHHNLLQAPCALLTHQKGNTDRKEGDANPEKVALTGRANPEENDADYDERNAWCALHSCLPSKHDMVATPAVAHRACPDRDQREPGLAPEPAKRVPQILEYAGEGGPQAGVVVRHCREL